MNSTVQVEQTGRVATVTIDRPPLNVLDIATIQSLHQTIEKVSGEGATDILVLRTAGERAFSAGVEVSDHTPDKIPSMLEAFHGLILLFLEIDPVSIAEVQGPALGGGAELALACDLVVAATESRFAFPEIDLACFPPVALATLPHRIGPQRAAELVLLGAPFSAEEARQMGLVNRTVPRKDLSSATRALVESLGQKSPDALKLTARTLRSMVKKSYTQWIRDAEDVYLKQLTELADMHEGIRAFMEKRKPRWRVSG
ncbi:MAG: enoyl-CoA hydratase/isomerase family protein [Planctomycetota bacterium]|nr:enoyl-CoA hydratase/isomerase family protein [Planctomycetota bacterium]